MVRLISRHRGGLAALKLTKLFGIDDFSAAKDSGKVLIKTIYCYLIIIIIIIIMIIIIIITIINLLMLSPRARKTSQINTSNWMSKLPRIQELTASLKQGFSQMYQLYLRLLPSRLSWSSQNLKKQYEATTGTEQEDTPQTKGTRSTRSLLQRRHKIPNLQA